MAGENQPTGSRISVNTIGRQCWICFANEEETVGLSWIKPCKCRGTTKWVHQACLHQWIDEKLKVDINSVVVCPQCRTEYLIYYPPPHFIAGLLDRIDLFITNACPVITWAIFMGSLYWTATSYGALIILHIGGSESMNLLQSVHPIILMFGLPLVPLAILGIGILKWEVALLDLLRTVADHVPLAHYILPNRITNESGASTEKQVSEGMVCTRIFTGAILLPVAAKICGDLIFQSVTSELRRSLLGGLTFLAVKSVFIMFHTQQTYKLLSRRRILDYTPENRDRIEATS